MQITVFILVFLALFCPVAASDDGPKAELARQLAVFEAYTGADTDAALAMLEYGLLSKDPLRQDNSVIFLSGIIADNNSSETLRRQNAEVIIQGITAKDALINAIIDIIDKKMPEWYSQQPEDEIINSVNMYKPLFYILGRSENVNSLGALSRYFAYLQGKSIEGYADVFARKKGFFELTFKRHQFVKNKLCCAYPGQDIVGDMMSKDMSLKMLALFKYQLENISDTNPQQIIKIRNFVKNCLDYDSAYAAFIIRMRALEVARRLYDIGRPDMLSVIEAAYRKDPFYLHKRSSGKNSKEYSYSEIYFPARDKAKSILAEIRNIKQHK